MPGLIDSRLRESAALTQQTEIPMKYPGRATAAPRTSSSAGSAHAARCGHQCTSSLCHSSRGTSATPGPPGPDGQPGTRRPGSAGAGNGWPRILARPLLARSFLLNQHQVRVHLTRPQAALRPHAWQRQSERVTGSQGATQNQHALPWCAVHCRKRRPWPSAGATQAKRILKGSQAEGRDLALASP